jgi:hypothetical protein
MTLKITPATDPVAANSAIFLSASIPNPSRWDGNFDALEITDAVVSLARVFLTAGWRIVSAAHPTIAPLLLYVAAELPATADRRVSIYQSSLFEDVLPTATRRFEADGIGTIIWTPAADGDRPTPGEWDASLEIMRRKMLTEAAPAAAAFIGGMQGIPDEFDLFAEIRPGRPRYPIGRPGGAAAALAEESASPLRQQLTDGVVYPAIWQAVLMEIEAADQPQ